MTVRAPKRRAGLIAMFRVALVGLLISSDVTVMSPPKEKVVLPLAKCVAAPVTVTLRLSA